MSQINIPSGATPLILGLLFPGVGHIVLGLMKKGIKIAVAFVILTYISGNILVISINSFLNEIQAQPIFYSLVGLTFIPPFGIWLWQLRDLMKIIGGEKKTENVMKNAD